MATHANSTPAPERTLLREVAAPGRLSPGPITPAHARDLCAINGQIKAMFHPSEMSEDEPGDFDGLLCETMREWQDDELASLKALHAEIEAKRAADLLAILDAGPLPHAFMSRAQRRAMQAGVDALIDYLDAIQPDCDLEPTLGFVMPGELDECEPDPDSESSLAATEFGSLHQPLWSRGTRADLEEECEDEGACIQSQPHDEENDREPALGAPDGIIDQTHWHGGPTMYSDESESSLGAPENSRDQRHWSQGSGSVELDHDEQSGLRSWGTYNETRLRTEQLRRETEAMLRRKGLVQDHRSNVILLHDGHPFVSGVVW